MKNGFMGHYAGIFHNIGGTLYRLVESFTHVRTFHNTSRVAFTLAEVLITLGIIGIVSALTIPTLIKNYQEKVRDNQFKKIYSTLNQAILLSLTDLGYMPKCYYPSAGWVECKFFWGAMKKNLKIVKICPNKAFENGCVGDIEGYDVVIKENHKNDENYNAENWDNFITNNIVGFTTNNIKNRNEAFLLSDGTSIILYNATGGAPIFLVDINGPSGKNKLGYDVFEIKIFLTHKNTLELRGSHETDRIAQGGILSGTLIKKLFGTFFQQK